MKYVDIRLAEPDLETLISWGFVLHKESVAGLSDHEDILLSYLQSRRSLLR
jgi:hypothetical protein